MENTQPSPQRIMQLIGGYQASALIAAGVTHDVFARIERGVNTAEAIARDAGIALRGAQALLDRLLGTEPTSTPSTLILAT